MDWTTDINLGGFGSGAQMHWRTVLSFEDFLDLFETAVHVDAVTYCESPELLLTLFEDYELDTMDILVGKREEYQSTISSVATARQLEKLCREDKLTVRLRRSKILHSKMYRLVEADETVKLVTGSANLSENSWRNQTNNIVVFETEVGSQLDEKFQQWLERHKEYSHTVFMDGLSEEIAALDDKDEREERIELWVDNRDVQLSDQGQLHSEASEELVGLAEQADEIYAVEEDPDDPDGTVVLESLEKEPVTVVAEDDDAGFDGSDTEPNASTDADADTDVVTPTEVTPDGGDVDSDESGFTAARASDHTITLPTQSLSDDFVDTLGENFETRGGTVGTDSISAPVDTYSNYVKEVHEIPPLSVDHETGTIALQDGAHTRELVAEEPATPEILDRNLANIERYVTTVDRWGEVESDDVAEAVKAHMYEAIIYFLWAPFANLYARKFHDSGTLDNILPFLYLHGRSDAGKDKLCEFGMRLISDDRVRGLADADNISPGDIDALRHVDSAFPYVISDIPKSDIRQATVLRNYWGEWSPAIDIDYPTLVFTSNDNRPKEWFRNRAKMLNFDVYFPSDPEEDANYYDAQQDLNAILNTHNDIFAYVARQMFEEGHYTRGDATVGHVRSILRDMYEEAGREQPDCFPAEESATQTHSVGKRKWEGAHDRGELTFETIHGNLVARFDMEGYEVNEYKRILPTRYLPEKKGTSITIGNSEEFVDWYPGEIACYESGETRADSDVPDASTDGESDGDSEYGLLERLFGR